MKYLLLHYFLMVYICNKGILGSPARRAGNYDIDDFINQLLASQKFDELAEKVAEKAVNKIKNMEIGGGEKVATKNFNEDEDLPHRYEEKNREHEDGRIAYRDREQRSNNDVDNVKPGKINTDALMKKDDDTNQADGLTLKYKYLKQHAMERKGPTPEVQNREHSEERNPMWRNVENYDEKQRQRIPVVREQPLQKRPMRPNSGENNNERNVNFGRNPSYDKILESPSNKFDKDRDNYGKGSDNENYKSRFEHEREQNENENKRPAVNEEMTGEKQEDEENARHEENARPQFKSVHIEETPVKASYEEPPAVIDLDDNYESRLNRPVEIEDPKNVYNAVEDQQRVPRAEDLNDDVEEEERRVEENENVFGEDRQPFPEVASSREDDAYRVVAESINDVTPEYFTSEPTTKKKLIRREGNRLYTYLSAPEYAEYHDLLAKQTKNPNHPFDIV